jgi:hypothetical protein
MRNKKGNLKKNFVYGIFLLLALGVTGYVMAGYFGWFSGGNGEGGRISLDLNNSSASEKMIKNINAKKAALKPIRVSLFKDERFLDLRERPESLIKIENLKPGKNNPFSPARK